MSQIECMFTHMWEKGKHECDSMIYGKAGMWLMAIWENEMPTSRNVINEMQDRETLTNEMITYEMHQRERSETMNVKSWHARKCENDMSENGTCENEKRECDSWKNEKWFIGKWKAGRVGI